MIILKIGGGRHINLEGIVKDLKDLEEKVLIVHGANALRDELGERLGQPKKTVTSVSGYASVYSDEGAIDLMMMAYSGLRNKRLVELCQKNGINALGLTGLDGGAITGKRNKGIRVFENKKKMLLRDFSGKPKAVNNDLLMMLLEHNYVPVLTPPIMDEKGWAINTENDDVVRKLAETLRPHTIVQLIEAPGLLKDPKDQESLIPSLSFSQCEIWESRAEGRMKRKLLAIKKLGQIPDLKVQISDGRCDFPLKEALNGNGTTVCS